MYNALVDIANSHPESPYKDCFKLMGKYHFTINDVTYSNLDNLELERIKEREERNKKWEKVKKDNEERIEQDTNTISTAIKIFEKFHEMLPGSATEEMVKKSSAGTDGWSQYNHKEAIDDNLVQAIDDNLVQAIDKERKCHLKAIRDEIHIDVVMNKKRK
jgi:hypothetical protein